MFKITKAVRQNVKLKIGISGPSGSGKTYSALQLAYGIAGDWSKVGVGDTENMSALYYSGMGPWQHIPFDPDLVNGGYHPNNYAALIRFAEQQSIDVLVLDSISHEWEGKGGCLDLVDQIGKGFASWKTVTPLHNGFMDALRLSPLHIIATMRSKQDYVVEQNEKGKSTPRKVGLKSIQREGADYDFGIVFDVDMNHFAKSSKDRTGLFMPRGDFKITPVIGQDLLEWATSGEEAPKPIRIQTPDLRGPKYNPENKAHHAKLFQALADLGIPFERQETISEAMMGHYRDELEVVIEETALAEGWL